MRSGIWKGSISFGLINIPVSVQSAKEHRELHFSLLDSKDLAPIKYRRVNADTGREVPYDRIVKGYEYKPDEYVVLTDQDFQAANPRATQTIDIQDFVPFEEIDPLFLDRPYYLVPQKDGEKGYFLLRDALAKSRKVAVATVVLRTKQHLTTILPRGPYLILELLRFAHEIKEVDEANYLEKINRRAKYTQRELRMAENLIKSMTSKWDPEKYKDTYYRDLMARIKTKIKKGDAVLEEPSEEIRPTATNVVDLLPLLRKSLAANKRSARRERA